MAAVPGKCRRSGGSVLNIGAGGGHIMHMTISGDRLLIGGRSVPFVPSPHVSGRIDPTLIVLHDTSDRLRADDSVSWFCNPKSKVSAHFVVGRDGSVTQLVPCDRAAYHAGQSAWCGRAQCNGFSIGIEIDSPGKLTRRGDKAFAWFGEGWPLSDLVEMTTPEHGAGWWMPYPEAQIAAVDGLIRALAIAYPSITDVAGHYHVSPRRKVDPGPQFPMARMQAILADRHAPDPELVKGWQTRLRDLGYQPGMIDGYVGERTGAAVWQFQRNNGLEATGRLDRATGEAMMRPDARGPVTAQREVMTPADVRATSGTMRATAGVQRTAEVAGIGVVADALSSPVPDAAAPVVAAPAPSGLAEAVSEVSGMVTTTETARGLLPRLTGLVDWMVTAQGMRSLAMMLVIGTVWWLARTAGGRRFRDYVTGRHAGG